MSNKVVNGPADGPKRIYGNINGGWAGPQSASIMGVPGDLTSVINDFSPGTGSMISDAADHVYTTTLEAVEDYWDRHDPEEVIDQYTDRRRPESLYSEDDREYYRSRLRADIEDTDIPHQVEAQTVSEIEDADPEDWMRYPDENGMTSGPNAIEKYDSFTFDDIDVTARLNVIASNADKRNPADIEPTGQHDLHKRILMINDYEDIKVAGSVGEKNLAGSRHITGDTNRTVDDHYAATVSLDTARTIASLSDEELGEVAEIHDLDRERLRETINEGLSMKQRSQGIS